jgi:hydroxyacylglutathione hydrolase
MYLKKKEEGKMNIKRLIGGFLESNGYIVYEKEGKECYIIDPGYDAKRYIDEITSMKQAVLGILLTHHHHDHVGAVEEIAGRFNCPVCLHEGDLKQYGKKVDIILNDRSIFKLGNKKIQVVHTPGHTKGSVCYYSESDSLVFTGDTIFNVDLGRTDLDGGSYKEMKESINAIISKWEDDVTIYPGHGDPATMKYVRENNNEYLSMLD